MTDLSHTLYDSFTKDDYRCLSSLRNIDQSVKLTHIQSPAQTFEAAVESVREISVVLVVGMESAPNVNELSAIGSFWWGEDVFKGCRFCFGITCSFIPVRFGIGEV